MGFEASHSCWQGSAERLLGRRDIVALMGELCRDRGAEHYVVCQIGSRQGAQCQRILASNWLYDALEDVGAETLARILRSHLADQFGETGPEGVTVQLPMTQEELASWAGSSREAAAKALRRLRERGLIRTGRMTITVPDLEALRRQDDR
jgi:hypothetical protein